jgi:methionine-rich copper-binding protein CopC
MRRSLALVLGMSLGLAAHAHTKLATTTPEANASVATPRAIELTFEGEVRLTAVSLSDALGAMKQLDAVPTAVASQFELAIRETLAPGDYKVVWRAVGGDTHIVSGEFAFKVVATPAH